MFVMKVFAFAFLVAGFGTVFAAPVIVRRRKLDEKVQCNFEGELSEEEVKRYKFDKASVNIKLMGLALSLPGLILLYLSFR
ncbi:MAG: hypothetical protein HGA22_14055 [Clostridiales bacterium]|nr:hypothetical protein [Clostridiales bacterium]